MRERDGYTLAELLAVLAIMSMLIALVGKLWHDGWIASHHATEQAENNQLVTILSRMWQQELRGTTSSEWEVTDAGFRSGKHEIRHDGNHLVFANADSAKRIRLPETAKCVFSIERNQGAADCAVLSLTLPAWYFDQQRKNTMRLVACGGAAR